MDAVEDELLWEFLVDSHENLDAVDAALVALEAAQDADTLAAIFRNVHTIKGTSGFFGLPKVERVAHVAESLLGRIRAGELPLDQPRATALLAATNVLRRLLAGLESTRTEPDDDIEPVVALLDAAASDDTAAATPVDPGAPAGPVADPEPTADLPAPTPLEPPPAAARPVTSMAAPVLTFHDDDDPDPPARTGDLLLATAAVTPDDLQLALALQGEGDLRPLGDILVDHGWAERPAVEAGLALQQRLRAGDGRHSAGEATVRVEVGVLDELMNLVGELVLARNSLSRSIAGVADRALLADAQRIDLVTSELQSRVLRTRMRAIRTVWAKLPRLVREVSVACGRRVALEMEGEDTELDKSVVDAIKDPMLHCVRNAIDHGIESPEDRVAAGKPAQGRLRVRASHDNGQVVIDVSDDGAGIDPARMRAAAVEKGLVTPAEARRLTDREAVELIFAPGFSTATEVTEVSGRGVGMDVVRTNVERIGGSVAVATEPGLGSTFTFTIPLTLAIVPALLVGIGDHRYAIPQAAVVELVRLTGTDTTELIEDMHGLGVHRLRGRLLPIVDGAALLRVDKPAPSGPRPRLQIAVLRGDGGSFGLVVDEIHGTEEIVVKPIGAHYAGLGCFAGATILGDGVVALIVDVPGLAARAGVTGDGAPERDSTLAAGIADDDGGERLMIVGLADGSRRAVPLERVARLETFERSRIEEVAGDRFVQYRDGLLPITAVGDWSTTGSRHTVVVVVVTTATGEVGLAVERVLDIATGAVRHGTISVAAGHTTEVVDVDSLADVLAVTVGSRW